jgi:hypothetical protein
VLDYLRHDRYVVHANVGPEGAIAGVVEVELGVSLTGTRGEQTMLEAERVESIGERGPHKRGLEQQPDIEYPHAVAARGPAQRAERLFDLSQENGVPAAVVRDVRSGLVVELPPSEVGDDLVRRQQRSDARCGARARSRF